MHACMYVFAIKRKIIKIRTHVILFVTTKKEEKLTSEEDGDYQTSYNGASDPGITD